MEIQEYKQRLYYKVIEALRSMYGCNVPAEEIPKRVGVSMDVLVSACRHYNVSYETMVSRIATYRLYSTDWSPVTTGFLAGVRYEGTYMGKKSYEQFLIFSDEHYFVSPTRMGIFYVVEGALYDIGFLQKDDRKVVSTILPAANKEV